MSVGDPKPHKFGARRTICKILEHPHPSALEAAVCDILSLRVRSGDIRNLKWQATVRLNQKQKWKVDWSFEQGPEWHPVWAEAKGKEDSRFRDNLRAWTTGDGPGKLELWKGKWQNPKLIKIYYPGIRKFPILGPIMALSERSDSIYRWRRTAEYESFVRFEYSVDKENWVASEPYPTTDWELKQSE